MSIIHKIKSNKKQNTLKSVSNRVIKSLNRVKPTKGVINTPKIVVEKPLLVEEPKVITLPKIAAKPKKSYQTKKRLTNHKYILKKFIIIVNLKIV